MDNDNKQPEIESLEIKLEKEIELEKKEKKTIIADKVFKEIAEWSICLFIAFFIAISIKYYIGTFTTVKQMSMHPTLRQNDKLWLDRTVRTFKKEYKVGDIATFEAPDINTIDQINNNNAKAIYKDKISLSERFVKNFLEINKISYIKRVIAVEGDHVQIIGGMIFVNGELMEEAYLDYDIYTASTKLTDFIVPESTLFLIGDNRGNSTDCRSFGCIPIEKMEGKIINRVLPLNSFGKVPTTFYEIDKLNNK